ncbi:MAG: phytoene/squalene synthase family protein [Alphaproteobacteria bacterium]
MTGTGPLSYCASELHRHDPERFLIALLAPAARREDLFALYAFNLEVAKTAEVVSEPVLGQIRLQWWRESLDGIYAGTPRRHYVVEPLARAIAHAGIERCHFEGLIDARDFQDLGDTPPADLAALETYAAATGGDIVSLALMLLSVRDPDALAIGRTAGTAYALTGLLRALPFLLQRGRRILPADLMARHGIADAALGSRQASQALRPAVAEIAALAEAHAAQARRFAAQIPRAQRSPMLHATLAAMHLRRLRRYDYDVFRPEIAEAPRFRAVGLLRHSLSGWV